jgi:hypothetical protein
MTGMSLPSQASSCQSLMQAALGSFRVLPSQCQGVIRSMAVAGTLTFTMIMEVSPPVDKSIISIQAQSSPRTWEPTNEMTNTLRDVAKSRLRICLDTDYKTHLHKHSLTAIKAQTSQRSNIRQWPRCLQAGTNLNPYPYNPLSHVKHQPVNSKLTHKQSTLKLC